MIRTILLFTITLFYLGCSCSDPTTNPSASIIITKETGDSLINNENSLEILSSYFDTLYSIGGDTTLNIGPNYLKNQIHPNITDIASSVNIKSATKYTYTITKLGSVYDTSIVFKKKIEYNPTLYKIHYYEPDSIYKYKTDIYKYNKIIEKVTYYSQSNTPLLANEIDSTKACSDTSYSENGNISNSNTHFNRDDSAYTKKVFFNSASFWVYVKSCTFRFKIYFIPFIPNNIFLSKCSWWGKQKGFYHFQLLTLIRYFNDFPF